MKKLLFFIALTAVARKVMCAVKKHDATHTPSTPNNDTTLHTSNP